MSYDGKEKREVDLSHTFAHRRRPFVSHFFLFLVAVPVVATTNTWLEAKHGKVIVKNFDIWNFGMPWRRL
jgi:hypothetical protein